MSYKYFYNEPREFWNDEDFVNDLVDNFNRKISASMKISAEDHSMLTALSKLGQQSRNSILNDIIRVGLQDVLDDIERNENLNFAKKLREIANKEFQLLSQKHFKNDETNMIENIKLRNLDLLIEHLEKLKAE